MGDLKKDIEYEYSVRIDKVENLLYVYNYFGRLIFIASTLEQVRRGLMEEDVKWH